MSRIWPLMRPASLEQHAVAGLVAEAVVDQLELVEVDEQEREPVAEAIGAVAFVQQAVLERAVTRDPRQPVDGARPDQLGGVVVPARDASRAGRRRRGPRSRAAGPAPRSASRTAGRRRCPAPAPPRAARPQRRSAPSRACARTPACPLIERDRRREATSVAPISAACDDDPEHVLTPPFLLGRQFRRSASESCRPPRWRGGTVLCSDRWARIWRTGLSARDAAGRDSRRSS